VNQTWPFPGIKRQRIEHAIEMAICATTTLHRKSGWFINGYD
jgi:hypothetical protein